ncbi:MAG: right-handed parallel beta-helix repeat-containing protein [Myxococcota bacterium]
MSPIVRSGLGLVLMVACGREPDLVGPSELVVVIPAETCDAVSCDGETPICDEGTCVACTEHDHCDSGVCDRDTRSCIDEADVVHVVNEGWLGDREPGEDTSGCGAVDRPCLTLRHGITRLDDASERVWLRLADGPYEAGPHEIEGRLFLIGGDDVRVEFSLGDTPPMFEVQPGGAIRVDQVHLRAAQRLVSCEGEDRDPGRVRIERSLLTDAQSVAVAARRCEVAIQESTLSGMDDVGLLAESSEVSVLASTIGPSRGIGVETDRGSLVLERTLVEGNREGGVHIDETDFVIRNNFVQDNGDSGVSGSSVGGILIERDGPEVRVFEFNSIIVNRNGTYSPYAAGVDCFTVGYIDIRNSVLWHNTRSQEETPRQAGGLCRVAYSAVEFGVTGDDRLEDGPGNLDLDPRFVDERRGDYRVSPDSPVIDAADPEANVQVDFDGTPRPAGAGFDMGAFESPAR